MTVGADTVIHPGVYLEGQHAHRRRLRDPRAACGSSTRRSTTAWSINNFCVITELARRERARSSVRSRTSGRSREVGEDAHVGNFVELKKTTLGRGSKANHLAYLGDATIGEQRQRRRRHDHLQLRRHARSIRR